MSFFLEHRDDPVAQCDGPLHDKEDEDAENDDEDSGPGCLAVDLMDDCLVIVDNAKDKLQIGNAATIEDVDEVADEEWDGAQQGILQHIAECMERQRREVNFNDKKNSLNAAILPRETRAIHGFKREKETGNGVKKMKTAIR